MARLTGRIKKMTSRGFGFIETADEIDYFFHYTDCEAPWKGLLSKYVEGEVLTVEFSVDKSENGPKAKEVKLIPNLESPPEKNLT